MVSYKLQRISDTIFVIKRKRVGVDHGLGSFHSGQSLSCTHSTIRDGRCLFCNQAMVHSFGLSFNNILPGLKYSEEEVLRMRKRNTKALLRKRKLHLVLDLDHTLLHCRTIKSLSSREKYLKKHVEDFKDTLNGSLFQMDDDKLVKFRPFVDTFLEQASSLFEMYICTMGTRSYAEKAVKLLDPYSKYFSSRIIAREDFEQKDRENLRLVLGQETNIIIIDDTESVWSDYTENLIVVGKYNYFRDKKRKEYHKSYSEMLTDESENNGALANTLRVLEAVYSLYFDSLAYGDIRTYLPKIRREILKGCSLLFSDGGDLIQNSSRAKEMGATCTIVIDSSITHLVSTETEDCLWAKQEQKYLVHPRWIDDCYFFWHRQPEDDYLP